jgi:hypothetical protein
MESTETTRNMLIHDSSQRGTLPEVKIMPGHTVTVSEKFSTPLGCKGLSEKLSKERVRDWLMQRARLRTPLADLERMRQELGLVTYKK